MTEEEINNLAIQLAGQLLIDSEYLHLLLGEDFAFSFDDSDYSRLQDAVESLGAALVRDLTAKYIPVEGTAKDYLAKVKEAIKAKRR